MIAMKNIFESRKMLTEMLVDVHQSKVSEVPIFQSNVIRLKYKEISFLEAFPNFKDFFSKIFSQYL